MMKTLTLSLLVSALCIATFGQQTITIYPEKNVNLVRKDNDPDVEDENFGTRSYLRTWEWTSGGEPYKFKGLLGIDLSALPASAFILEAKLYLYGTGDHNSYVIDGSGYQPNDSYLRRVTSSWIESNVTWNTAPSTTTTNQVTIPSSTTADQDYVVDVTKLIKDIQLNASTSDGLILSLVNEAIYTDMCFASSDHPTSSMHPKLEITYQVDALSIHEGFELTEQMWYNVSGDDLDWILKTGTTPSSGTGPTGASEGSTYAYVEASSPNYPGKTAYLESDEFYLPEADYISMFFDYHMYGSTMGSLILEISTNQGSTWSQIWSMSGNQGNSWHTKEISLNNYAGGSVLLRYKATTGSNYISDICVDNILIIGNRDADVSTDENYVYSRIPQSINGLTGLVQDQVQYYDGLGRSRQEISIGSSPAGNDVIRPIDYDSYGRVSFDYLPFSASDDEIGTFRDYKSTGDDVLSMQEDFFQDHFNLGTSDPYALSEIVYDGSSMYRVLAEGAPGQAYQPTGSDNLSGNTQKFEYDYNSGTDVLYYYVESDGDLAGGTSNYAANELFKNEYSDEEDNTHYEFVTKEGQTVLKRQVDGSSTYSTYYVYDDFGLLRYILPPKADADNGLPSSTELASLCYRYSYDPKQRMIEKTLPGVDSVYLVYDDRDRVVATQDAEMRNANEWLFTKYDAMNRPVISGIMTLSTSLTRSFIQSEIEDFYTSSSKRYEERTSTGNGYTDQTYPTTDSYISTKTTHTINYYDNYDHLSLTGFSGLSFDNTNNIDSYANDDGNSNGYFDRVINQLTGTATILLDGSGSNWICSSNYYDNKYRIIQVKSTLYPQGSTMLSTEFDFVGKVVENLEIQTVNSVENKIRYTHSYDHAGRLKEKYMYYNNEIGILMAQNEYNELDELVEKNLHSTDYSSFIQSVDYTYNIRGWLNGINDPESLSGESDLFGLTLYYDDLDAGLGSNETYNGNISGMQWGRNGSSTSQAYAFTYDGLNRLTATDFGTKTGSTWTTILTNYETTYSYDLNGNIDALTRKNSSGTTIDNVTYTYVGNQLGEIVDTESSSIGVIDDGISGTDYDYDDNGNMEWDRNKDIRVDYNHLNLPEKIYEESGTGDEILYIYDATGIKWLKVFDDGSSENKTMYAGSFVYEDNDGDLVDDFGLDFILNSEGKIANISTTFEYHYHLKDHLGNTRVVFDGSGNTEQAPDYYPFGMLFNSSQGGDNEYLFNGKELQDELLGSVNLDWYDYGARFYDPALGRWHSVDPMAEDYASKSPYHFSGNNPVRFLDLNGMNYGDYYNTDGTWLGSDGIDDEKVYTADAVTKNDKGIVTGAENANELSISHSEFQTISAIVKHEVGTSDANENLWIAHTANNAANASETSLHSKLMSGYSSAPSDIKLPLSTSANSAASNSARAGVLNVLTGGADPTGGSTLWDGTDFLAWGLNSPYGGKPHAKFRQYNNISISGDIYTSYLGSAQSKYPKGRVRYSGKYYNIPAAVFQDESNWTKSGFNYNTGYNRSYGIKATGAFGHSIFWKKVK